MSSKLKFFGILVVLILQGLISCNDHIVSPDSWYQAPPDNSPLLYWEGNTISDSYIHMVLSSKQADSEKLLQDISILELNKNQAEEFAGKQLPEALNTTPYLVRGVVYADNYTGKFKVLVNGDQLRVHFGCLGRSHTPIIHQALIVQLEKKPLSVFVTCSMAR